MSVGVFSQVVLSSSSVVDLNDIVTVCAVVEARVYYDTLRKVAELLHEARKRGISLDKVVDLLGEWLSEAELYERMVLEESDRIYARIRKKLEELGAER